MLTRGIGVKSFCLWQLLSLVVHVSVFIFLHKLVGHLDIFECGVFQSIEFTKLEALLSLFECDTVSSVNISRLIFRECALPFAPNKCYKTNLNYFVIDNNN